MLEPEKLNSIWMARKSDSLSSQDQKMLYIGVTREASATIKVSISGTNWCTQRINMNGEVWFGRLKILNPRREEDEQVHKQAQACSIDSFDEKLFFPGERRHIDRRSISRCWSVVWVIIRWEEDSPRGEASQALEQDGEGGLQAAENPKVHSHFCLLPSPSAINRYQCWIWNHI